MPQLINLHNLSTYAMITSFRCRLHTIHYLFFNCWIKTWPKKIHFQCLFSQRMCAWCHTSGSTIFQSNWRTLSILHSLSEGEQLKKVWHPNFPSWPDKIVKNVLENSSGTKAFMRKIRKISLEKVTAALTQVLPLPEDAIKIVIEKFVEICDEDPNNDFLWRVEEDIPESGDSVNHGFLREKYSHLAGIFNCLKHNREKVKWSDNGEHEEKSLFMEIGNVNPFDRELMPWFLYHFSLSDSSAVFEWFIYVEQFSFHCGGWRKRVDW